MHRYFLVLAVTVGSLLAASFVLGLKASTEVPGPGAIWHGIHFLFALLTTLATLAVHSVAYTYFLATGKWAKEVVHVYRLPEWINDQAKKNKRKAFRFQFRSMTLIAITAWLGAAADTQGMNPLWHLGMASVTIAFNLGAFAAQYAIIVAQTRLLLEVKMRADQLRGERYGSESSVAAAPSPAPGEDRR